MGYYTMSQTEWKVAYQAGCLYHRPTMTFDDIDACPHKCGDARLGWMAGFLDQHYAEQARRYNWGPWERSRPQSVQIALSEGKR